VVGQGHKLEGLQAARAIAALTVAYYHSYVAIRSAFPESAWLPIAPLKDWGFLGVNFFFAISGYVICLVASKPSFNLRSFTIKRQFRLYPMYWVTMAIVLGRGAPLGGSGCPVLDPAVRGEPVLRTRRVR
jgi:exopolysaccharide production protein ExoZ